jgi:hypothetical protein
MRIGQVTEEACRQGSTLLARTYLATLAGGDVMVEPACGVLGGGMQVTWFVE